MEEHVTKAMQRNTSLQKLKELRNAKRAPAARPKGNRTPIRQTAPSRPQAAPQVVPPSAPKVIPQAPIEQKKENSEPRNEVQPPVIQNVAPPQAFPRQEAQPAAAQPVIAPQVFPKREVKAPVQQAAPPQAFPRQEAPPQAFPRQEAPPQAFPRQEAPPQAFPRQEAPPQAFPRQETRPQAFPRQEAPPQAKPRQEAQPPVQPAAPPQAFPKREVNPPVVQEEAPAQTFEPEIGYDSAWQELNPPNVQQIELPKQVETQASALPAFQQDPVAVEIPPETDMEPFQTLDAPPQEDDIQQVPMFAEPERSDQMYTIEENYSYQSHPQAEPEDCDSPLALAAGPDEAFTTPESLMPDIQNSVDREKLALLEQENEEMRNEIRKLKAQLNPQDQTETQRLNERLEKSEQKIGQLSKELNNSRLERNKLKEHIKSICASHNNYKDQAEQLINNLREEKEQLQNKVTDLINERATEPDTAPIDANPELMTENMLCREENDTLRQLLFQKEEIIATLENDLARLQREYDDTQDALNYAWQQSSQPAEPPPETTQHMPIVDIYPSTISHHRPIIADVGSTGTCPRKIEESKDPATHFASPDPFENMTYTGEASQDNTRAQMDAATPPEAATPPLDTLWNDPFAQISSLDDYIEEEEKAGTPKREEALGRTSRSSTPPRYNPVEQINRVHNLTQPNAPVHYSVPSNQIQDSSEEDFFAQAGKIDTVPKTLFD